MAHVTTILFYRADHPGCESVGLGHGDELEGPESPEQLRFVGAVLNVLPHTRVDGAGRNKRGLDRVGTELKAQRGDEVVQTRLRAAVGSQSGETARTGERAEKDEVAATPLDHARDHLAGQHHRRFQIHPDHIPNDAGLNLGEGVCGIEASVIHQNVDGADLGFYLGDQAFDLMGIEQVGAKRNTIDVSGNAIEFIPLRAVIETRAPAAANLRASCSPIPRDPPVTNTCLFRTSIAEL